MTGIVNRIVSVIFVGKGEGDTITTNEDPTVTDVTP